MIHVGFGEISNCPSFFGSMRDDIVTPRENPRFAYQHLDSLRKILYDYMQITNFFYNFDKLPFYLSKIETASYC
jgi:hypothetical protein